jgi:hypothetical protein
VYNEKSCWSPQRARKFKANPTHEASREFAKVGGFALGSTTWSGTDPLDTYDKGNAEGNSLAGHYFWSVTLQTVKKQIVRISSNAKFLSVRASVGQNLSDESVRNSGGFLLPNHHGCWCGERPTPLFPNTTTTIR